MKVGVSLWDMVHVDGSDWQVIATTRDTVALRDVHGRELKTMSLSVLLNSADFSLLDPGQSLPPLEQIRTLETLPTGLRQKALFLEQHLQEVLTGLPPGTPPGVLPRADYRPDKTLTQRVEAKCLELESMGLVLSSRSMWRHLARYRSDGTAGLIDPRVRRPSPVTGRVEPALVAIAKKVLVDQTKRSTGNQRRVIAEIALQAEVEGLALPSRATLYRLLKALDRQRHSFGNATTRRTQANRPDRGYGRQTPSRPGELVEIDSTPLDVLVLYPDGGSGRVDLIVDQLSRLPHVRWEPSRKLARFQIRWASSGGGYVYLNDEGDDPEQEIETWRVSQRLHRFTDRLIGDSAGAGDGPLPVALAGVP